MLPGEEEAQLVLRLRLGKGARYDAIEAPAQDLRWARRGTAYFARRLNELSDADLDGPSLAPGLSRRELVAMAGYQARNLALAIEELRTGLPVPLPDAAKKAGQIALGTTLPARALRNLFAHAEVHLNVEWRDLDDAGWGGVLRGEDGRPFPVRQSAWLRARFLWLASVDLGNGGSFRDAPPDLLDALAIEAAAGLPPLELAATDRATPLRTGTGALLRIEGRMADLARWLTGRGALRLLFPAGASLPVPDWRL